MLGQRINIQRSLTDLYDTDPRWLKILLDHIELETAVWECADGNGNLSKLLVTRGYSVRATDILRGDDFLTITKPWEGAILTNPPYSLATEFIIKALSLTNGTVAMLLPLHYLGGKDRFKRIYRTRPPTLILVIPSRMKVNQEASQFNHAWCVWEKERKRSTRLEWGFID